MDEFTGPIWDAILEQRLRYESSQPRDENGRWTKTAASAITAGSLIRRPGDGSRWTVNKTQTSKDSDGAVFVDLYVSSKAGHKDSISVYPNQLIDVWKS